MICTLPQFYRHSEPIARKEHICCECKAPILRGEKHFSCVGRWDGKVSAFRQHLACMEACMLIRDKFNDGECIAFGDLLSEAWGEIRWQYNRHGPQAHVGEWKPLRELMAKILKRQRRHLQGNRVTPQ